MFIKVMKRREQRIAEEDMFVEPHSDIELETMKREPRRVRRPKCSNILWSPENPRRDKVTIKVIQTSRQWKDRPEHTHVRLNAGYARGQRSEDIWWFWRRGWSSLHLPGVYVQCRGFLVGLPAQNFSNKISVPTLVVIVSCLLLSIPAYSSIQVVIHL